MQLTPLQPWIERKIGCMPGELTRQWIEAYQLARLNSTIAHVRARSPFYRQHLEGSPGEIKTLSDLASLPFTTADDLRSQPLQMVCVSQNGIERVVTLDTSGTSGTPKRIYFTSDDQELTVDFFGVGMTSLVSQADRVLVLLPGETPGSVGDLLVRGLGWVGITAIKHGPVRDPFKTLSIMREEGITSLVGVPSHVLTLTRAEEAVKPSKCLHLNSILLSTDNVPSSLTAVLEQSWGCQVFNHYGMTEMGLGGGVSCSAQRGYHLREADMYFEVVDPDSASPLPDGEYGEVVFTTLTRTGMPLIRYRTGDISRFIPGDCPCSTSLKTMEFIRTRLNTRLQMAGGVLSISDLDEVLFKLPGVANYKASLGGGDGNDVLRVELQVFIDQPGLAPFAAQMIMGLPGLRSALQDGMLTIEVDQKIIQPGSHGSMAKRKIVDNRAGLHT